MRAGMLRHRVTIQRRTESRDAAGSDVGTWSDVATVYGRVEPFAGNERVKGAQVAATTTHTVTMRYDGCLLPSDRLTWDGRTLEIESILDDKGAQRSLTILARERAR